MFKYIGWSISFQMEIGYSFVMIGCNFAITDVVLPYILVVDMFNMFYILDLVSII